MSDSYSYSSEEKEPWGKLQTYLEFRLLCEGLWITHGPHFWFDAITNDNIHILRSFSGDTGGGPVHHFYIRVFKEYGKRKRLFEISLSFDEVFSYNAVFIKRAEAVYRYMESYSKGETWFDKACWCYGEEPGEDNGFVDHRLWNKLFGPLEDISRVSNEDYASRRNILPANGFGLLSNLSSFPSADISFRNKTAVSIQKAREWALFALLEMQRQDFTTC